MYAIIIKNIINLSKTLLYSYLFIYNISNKVISNCINSINVFTKPLELSISIFL